MPRLSLISCSTLAIGLLLAACGETAPPVPTAVVVSPSDASAVTVGQQLQFSAQVLDETGKPISGASVIWSSSSETVATASDAGTVTVTGQGVATIRASHETLSGSATLTVWLEPAAMTKTAGDNQTAPSLTILPTNPTVLVTDAGGAPIPARDVHFLVISGGGQVESVVSTNSAGEASARWTLGEASGQQLLRATLGSLQADFTVTATGPPLLISTDELDKARAKLPYLAQLQARFGTAPFVWSVVGGSLPSGVQLRESGEIAGTAQEMGSHSFTVQVVDAEGDSARKDFSLRICKPPLDLSLGGVVVMNVRGTTSDCLPFLPAGDAGDRYRLGVVRTSTNPSSSLAKLTLRVTELGAAGNAVSVSQPEPPQRTRLQIPPEWAEAVRIAEATSRFHSRLHSQAPELLQRFGRDAVLPDQQRAAAGSTATEATSPPEERITIRPFGSSRCSQPGPTPVPAFLVGYNSHLAIYQDSVQRAEEPVDLDNVQRVLDYYDAYGHQTIENYFGGVSDINDDGRVTIFISPVVASGIAAFVWSGDFFELSQCAGSNEQELVYFAATMFHGISREENPTYQAMGTMVHEIKHVSSLYKRLTANSFHPSWVEEGTAEIASETSSRKALEALGTIPTGARFTRDAYPPRSGSIISPENYGVLLRLLRTLRSYGASTVNSVVTNPDIRGDYHSYYGTSWHFHRFLGDAYGDAAQGNDGTFFSNLNASSNPSGVAGIQATTGLSMITLLEEYATTMMLNGTGAPEPVRGFQTYDFPSAMHDLLRPGSSSTSQPPGFYPWPHTGPTPVSFQSAVYEGDLAPAGIRMHDFVSGGNGYGIEIDATMSGGAGRLVIVRLR